MPRRGDQPEVLSWKKGFDMRSTYGRGYSDLNGMLNTTKISSPRAGGLIGSELQNRPSRVEQMQVGHTYV